MSEPSADLLAVLAKANELQQEFLALRRPAHNGRKPYYTPKHGAVVREAINSVLDTGRPMIFPLDGMSANTVYLRVTQAKEWLRDHDPEFVSRLNAVVIKRIEKVGVKISPLPLKAAVFISEDWRPALLDFIETAKANQKFERVVLLTEDDITWVYRQLADFKENFIADIRPDFLLVVRV